MSRAKRERFEARPSWWKVLLGAALGLVMTGASVALIASGDLTGWIIGGIGAAFFGLCTLGILRQLFRTGPAMAIDTDGLMWRRWSDEVIPWRAFTHAHPTNGMLSLWLADPAAYRSKKLLGRLARLNSAGGYGDIILMGHLLDCSFEDMVGAVYLHRPSLFRR